MPRKVHGWLDRPGVRDALASGVPVSKIAVMAGTSHQNISQYIGRHFKPALELAQQAACFKALAARAENDSVENLGAKSLAQAALMAGPLLQRISKRYDDVDELIPSAKKKKDFRGFAALASTEARYMELQADLTGLRGQAGTQNQFNIALILPTAATEGPETQGETIEAVVSDEDI